MNNLSSKKQDPLLPVTDLATHDSGKAGFQSSLPPIGQYTTGNAGKGEKAVRKRSVY